MSRLSKKHPHHVLDRAAATLIAAAGSDKQLSRADQRQAISQASGAERGLLANLAAFARYRFAPEARARLTVTKIEAARDLAKQQLIDRFDVNRNGLSGAEIGRLRRTTKIGWLAVLLGSKHRAGLPLDLDEL